MIESLRPVWRRDFSIFHMEFRNGGPTRTGSGIDTKTDDGVHVRITTFPL